MELAGLLIRTERLRRGWSQEGLCRGICAVSYLSRLEQGKARASEEILRLLFARLELDYDGGETDGEALDECRELLLCGDEDAFRAQFEALAPHAGVLRRSRRAADFGLLNAFYSDEAAPLDEAFEPFLDARQLAMQRVLQNDFAAALALDPAPYYRMLDGMHSYYAGRYTEAAAALQRACDAAAEQGMAHLMLRCRVFLGNCYSDLQNAAQMREHYAVAARLARALGDQSMLRTIRYNIASTDLIQGDAQAAYRYFSALEDPTAMELHKLAVCCEQLGRREEALRALDAAAPLCGSPDPLLHARMLEPVRYRLEHPDYLHDAGYGELLTGLFAEIRRVLPSGYARFHLPWMLEWYQANRQYRQAFLLMQEFS